MRSCPRCSSFDLTRDGHDERGRIVYACAGFYNRVISTNRCERNHGYLKSRLRPMRGLKSFDCAKRLLPALEALQVIERGFVRCVMYWAAAHWRTELCARTQLCRHRQPARIRAVSPDLALWRPF
jgi:hypothetical protein